MPTEVERFVNTASTAGGDGTTNGTAGGTRAYATLEEALSNEAKNLVGADENLVISLDGAGGDDTVIIDLTGFTTDPTRNIKMRGNPGVSTGRHTGKDDGTTYRLATNTNDHVVTVNQNDCVFEGFIVGPMGSNHGNSSEAFRVNETGCLWDAMIMRNLDQNQNHDAIYAGASNITIDARNCLFYEIDRSAVFAQGVSGCTFRVNNCTAYFVLSQSGTYAIFGPDGSFGDTTGTTFGVKNCIAHRGSNTTVCYREDDSDPTNRCHYTADSDNNLSSRADGTTATEANTVWELGQWANNIVSAGWQDVTTTPTGAAVMCVNLTVGSEDLHLLDDVNNSPLDFGADLSADALPVVLDIDFETRADPYDIGSDEIVAAPTGTDGEATLTGTGALTATGVGLETGSAVVTGTGEIVAGAISREAAAASITGTGELTADAIRREAAEASLTGVGELTADGVGLEVADAIITGTGEIVASGFDIGIDTDGRATLIGVGLISATPFVSVFAVATMTGVGEIVATGKSGDSAEATITGTGDIVATGKALEKAAATLTGAGFISATPGGIRAGAASLTGAGEIDATGFFFDFPKGEAFLNGSGFIVARGRDLNPEPVETGARTIRRQLEGDSE